MGKIRYIITLWITKVIAKMLRLIAKERGKRKWEVIQVHL